MGSSGSGEFGNYAPSKEPKCDRPLEFSLEEVARSEFFASNKTVPSPNTSVRLAPPPPVNGRLVVLDSSSGAVVGLIPTSLNFLLACMGQGYHYSGEVTESAGGKLPRVTVKLNPAR